MRYKTIEDLTETKESDEDECDEHDFEKDYSSQPVKR